MKCCKCGEYAEVEITPIIKGGDDAWFGAPELFCGKCLGEKTFGPVMMRTLAEDDSNIITASDN